MTEITISGSSRYRERDHLVSAAGIRKQRMLLRVRRQEARGQVTPAAGHRHHGPSRDGDPFNISAAYAHALCASPHDESPTGNQAGLSTGIAFGTPKKLCMLPQWISFRRPSIQQHKSVCH